jgi:hypothetical protein
MEIFREIELYRSLLYIAKDNNDIEFYNQERTKFNNYNEMMAAYKRENE